MKIIPVILFFCLTTAKANAENYYFSSEAGDDSRTVAEAQYQSTPWKTLDKLNSFASSLKPGDTVFLKRDEVFYGSITLKSSGTVSFPITIGAYGLGNRPVITSLIALDGWVSTGNGVWESPTSLGSSVNMVLLNGIEQEMGRYPNSNEANGGYLNFESHSGKTSITDKQLNTSINWTGAELVTRPRHWILNRCLITGQSGQTISYTTNSPYDPTENYGYFIQNSLKALDKLGEWYYNPSTKRLSVYFGSTDPSSYTIQATTMGDLVSCSGVSNIVFDNLTVMGANGSGFLIGNGSNIFIQNCDILFSGVTGALVHGHNNFHVENCTISNSNNCGIDMEYSVTNAVIKNNKVLNSGLIGGLIKNGEGTGIGIYSNGEGADIESNQITNSGYIGISFYGSDVIIKNNVIDRFCFVKDDGGGVYSHGGALISVNTKIAGNIIMNGIGAGPGTDNANKRSVSGIYMDANVWNIDITGNTITTCYQGIFLQSSNGMTVTNNTVFDNTRQLIIIQREGNNLVRNTIVTQNNFFSRDEDQWALYIISNADDIGSFGTFDNNYYARPADDGLSIFNSSITNGRTVNVNMDLGGWQNRYGQDAHSKKSPVTIPATSEAISQSIRFEFNATDEPKSIALDARYLDVAGKRYSNNIQLPAYTSIVLIKSDVQKAPTVNITSPGDNAGFTAPASFNITADAADIDGSITRVDFYNGTTLLGSSLTKPYSFSWDNVPAGNYSLTAKAIDDDDIQTTSAQALVAVKGAKTAPVVSITTPDVNATFTDPAIITISAAAIDADGSITKVEFFNGSTLLSTVEAPPYTFTWNNVTEGNYLLIAKATDDGGLTTISDAVSVSVAEALTYPVVSMTAPAVNSTYTEPATITMSATASDANGSISKVEFFAGTILLNTQQSPPYDFTWQDVPAGNYLITAKATDNDGLSTVSDVVSVSVTKTMVYPTVNITAPVNNSTYAEPATINISATAYDADGSITKVEFFNGSTLLNTLQSPPFNFSWQSVAAGSYSLTAKVTDNDGLTATSEVSQVDVTAVKLSPVVNITSPLTNAAYTSPAAINISVAASDPDGAISKVEIFNGTTLLNTRQSPPYNFTWQDVTAGNYSLTAKATDNDGLTKTSTAVLISVKDLVAPSVAITTPAVNSKYTALATIIINASASDADGTVNKVEFFNGTTLLSTAFSSPYTFTWRNVPEGNYSLTAKATDNDGLTKISAAVPVSVTGIAPVVNLTSPANNSTYKKPATITITATATDADGSVSKVEFFSGATLLSTRFGLPYSYTWQNVSAGSYSITAKATDNKGLATTSTAVSVAVTAGTPPVVNMTSPANNSTYTEPGSITMTATATDADGKIGKIDFLNGTVLLKSLSSSPYTFTWKNVAAGTYSLTAKATDNSGLTATSSGRTVVVKTVVKNKPPTITITKPTGNASFTAPANIQITATANDADGSVSKVEFFKGTTLLKTEQTNPYAFNWNKVPAGKYTITAKATDNKGLVTTSAAVTVTVKAKQSASRASSAGDPPPPSDISPADNQPVSITPTNGIIELTGNKEMPQLSAPPGALGFSLFPDPAVNTIQIYFDNQQVIGQKADLTIHNSLGALIKKYPVTINSRKIPVDISALSTGIYIIGVSNNSFIIKKKFLKKL